MSGRLLLPIAAAALAAQGTAIGGAAIGGAAAQGGRKHDTNAPIDISADRTEVQDRINRATWIGNVHAVQGDMTMDSQRMTVAYLRAAQPGADPQIQRIDASGGVTVVNPTERAKGDYGIYDLDRKLITLIGHVTLVRGGNTVNGARLVIDTTTNRATVDGSAVGAPGKGGGRVTGRFTVPKRKDDAAGGGGLKPAASGATPGK